MQSNTKFFSSNNNTSNLPATGSKVQVSSVSQVKVILDPRIPRHEPETGEAFIGCHGALDGRGVAVTDDVGHDTLVPLAEGGGWGQFFLVQSIFFLLKWRQIVNTSQSIWIIRGKLMSQYIYM